MAMAALDRLGLSGNVTYVLDPSEMLPQVGQGALAVECRAGDADLLELLSEVDDEVAHRALVAERSWLAQLGGGCNTPVAAFAQPDAAQPDTAQPDTAQSDVAQPDTAQPDVTDSGSLRLEGMIASHDGRIVLRHSAIGSDPEELGRRLAVDMLTQCGASALEEWGGQ
jgi:hydroxymethylbilane synthase